MSREDFRWTDSDILGYRDPLIFAPKQKKSLSKIVEKSSFSGKLICRLFRITVNVKSSIEDALLFNFRISDRASIQDFQKFREINFLRASNKEFTVHIE